MSAAKFVRSEHRFYPPDDAEPIAVTRHGVSGYTIAYIFLGDAQLSVVVHETAGTTATVTGSQLHEPTGRGLRTTTLSRTWSPDGRDGFDDLAEAPEWVREAVAQVTA